ncbi:hypothetical protein MCOR25_006355 [Pyricularia grisea]|nr:hypothetical protein MCOR25_006355 [Pyricularia grisea]
MRLDSVICILSALAAAADGRYLYPGQVSAAQAADDITTPGPDHILHEERNPLTERVWTRSRRLYNGTILPIRIGLVQQNLHRAEEFMNRVSHPSSPDYGKHWTADEVVEAFAPKQESVDAVMDWLAAEGIERHRVSLSLARTWVMFNATAAEAEALLKTRYHVYRHSIHGHAHVACDGYHVPRHVVEHVDLITPTVHFDSRVGQGRRNIRADLSHDDVTELKRRSDGDFDTTVLGKGQGRRGHGLLGQPGVGGPKKGAVVENAMLDLSNCDRMVTLECLRALYSTPPGETAVSNNTMGIVEYTPQAFLQSDLDMFFEEFEPRLKGKPPIVTLIDNGVVQQQNQSFDYNGESALDLEFAMGLIYPQKATLYQVGDLNQAASFNNFLEAIDGTYCDYDGGRSVDPNVDAQYSRRVACGTTTPTNVISTSYGYNEADLGVKYEQRQCAEYMKLGLRGVSMLFSSGDAGVAGNGGQCIDEATGAYNDGSQGYFNPSFPASCPWVTAVGATTILKGSTVHTPESACENVIFSGGGFSNVFKMPDYQKSAIDDYYKDNAPPYGQERYNNSRTVRGYPDVSANGANFVTAVNGQFSLSYGTSASTPVFGSILTLINEKRIAAGKSPVGFVNPVLYNHPEVLNDITNGKNPGCGTDGFSAVSGWDPVTGLGTPNYKQMLQVFMDLP